MLMQTLVAYGFEAAYSLTGVGALEAVAWAFDAVVTDFRMPGMDGQELARKLKALRADLPIIIYSGQGGHIAQNPLFSAVLAKPVNPAELIDAVRRAVSGNDRTGWL